MDRWMSCMVVGRDYNRPRWSRVATLFSLICIYIFAKHEKCLNYKKYLIELALMKCQMLRLRRQHLEVVQLHSLIQSCQVQQSMPTCVLIGLYSGH